jgi:mono/diheme cytochrome c family protein
MSERSGDRSIWRRAAPLAAAVVVWSAAAQAQEAPVQTHPGRDLFVQYCGSCHGPEGKGDGPMAGELKLRPTDLTQLSKRLGSPLPKQKLLEMVDGRDMPRSHGISTMPVWGEQLLRETPPGAGKEAHKRGTMLVIVDWIEAIQAP